MQKFIKKQIVNPEHRAGQLFLSENEINKLKEMIKENETEPDTNPSDDMLNAFPSSSDFFPRDGKALGETNDILFELQILDNLSEQAKLILYQNMINPSKLIYIISKNTINYTPISFDKTTINNIYSNKSEYTKTEVIDIYCKGKAHKTMRDFLSRHFYGNLPSSMENTIIVDRIQLPNHFSLPMKIVINISKLLSKLLNKEKEREKFFNEQQKKQHSELETVYVMEDSKTYADIDLSYVRSKLPLPILELDDSQFLEILKNSFNFMDLNLLKRKMDQKKHSAICPIHGPVEAVIGGIISPTWTWEALCGRHWEFLLCPHCFLTFRQFLVKMN